MCAPHRADHRKAFLWLLPPPPPQQEQCSNLARQQNPFSLSLKTLRLEGPCHLTQSGHTPSQTHRHSQSFWIHWPPLQALLNADLESQILSYGFKITLPNCSLFSSLSCAAAASRSGKLLSTTGLILPEKICFITSWKSPMVPMKDPRNDNCLANRNRISKLAS